VILSMIATMSSLIPSGLLRRFSSLVIVMFDNRATSLRIGRGETSAANRGWKEEGGGKEPGEE
jgi:hypothetical protein